MIIRKDVLSLTGPIVAEQTFIMLMGIINTMMAGRLGKEAVSAIGMVDSINSVFISFFTALAVGGTVVVAQYTGIRLYHKANEAASHVLLSGAVISVAVTLLIFLFRNPILAALMGNADQLVIDYSRIYLEITLFSYPLIALTAAASGVLRGAGDTKTSMKCTILMNILNIVLSYVLIYGLQIQGTHFFIKIPAMGVLGAAWGIAVARSVGALFILYSLLYRSGRVNIAWEGFLHLDVKILRSIFGIGIPASIESLLFMGGKLITQVFIVGMGTTAMAANYIASSVLGMIFVPGLSISLAATTLVGQSMGQRKCQEAQDTLMYLVKLCSVCMLVICLLLLPAARFFTGLFTTSSDVVEETRFIIYSAVLAVPLLWPLSFILPAGLKGAGDARYTLLVSIFGMWAFRITMGYVFGVPLKMGPMGIWLGMYVDWLVRAVLFYLRLIRGKWKENVAICDVE